MKTAEPPKPIIVRRNVKHEFTPEETAELNTQFRQAYQTLKATEAEFDNVKAVWKSKTTEAEARMETLSATLNAGFEMRNQNTECVLRPLDKKKDFYLWPAPEDEAHGQLIATEDMTPDDFAQDLIRAEAAFSKKVEIELWSAERCLEWIDETLGKEPAKGFKEPVQAKIEAEREKAE